MLEDHDADRVNEQLCADCGGMCCLIYFAHDENGDFCGDGWLEAEIDVWLERFRSCGALSVDPSRYGAGAAGVEPLHDPRLSSLPTAEGEAYRETLPDWVDVRRCQFCHPDTGCLLPRDRRAPICNSWVCDLWVDGPSSDSETGAREGGVR